MTLDTEKDLALERCLVALKVALKVDMRAATLAVWKEYRMVE
jgi:hypothetical protein